jgi:hypothetical protein
MGIIWKKVFVVKSMHNAGIFLEELGKTKWQPAAQQDQIRDCHSYYEFWK